MFYVSGKSVYFADYDEEKKLYHQVKLEKDEDGNFMFKQLPTGVAQKPKDRSLCNKEEVIAQFGASVGELLIPDSDETPVPAPAGATADRKNGAHM